MLNRYTPIPPIAPSPAPTSDADEKDGSDASDADSDDETTADEDEALDEDFQLDGKQYEDVKPVMRKRMLALSQLETFDDEVSNSSRCFALRYDTIVYVFDVK